ncbi:MAG: segregation/condensation protein A [bacterium]|nr:segregation/condensation protein A [bacterium]
MREYHFHLEKFQGPLDLLLELLDAEKLKITDISLARIAEQYLAYVEKNSISPEQISDFLVIAARLLLLKSKALLPDLELAEEEEEDLEDLKQRLIIYQKYKLLAQRMRKLEQAGEYSLPRVVWFSDQICFSPPDNLEPRDLTRAYFQTIQDSPREDDLEKKTVSHAISLREKIKFIQMSLRRRMEMTLESLAKTGDGVERIVAFLAILELLRRRKVFAEQAEPFAEIKIRSL